MKIVILTTIFLSSIFAQGQTDRVSRDKLEIRKQRMEQLNSQRQSTMIGVQTTYLNLSTEQAEKFFPMQNEYKNEVKETQKKYRNKISSLRKKAKNVNNFDVDTAIKFQKEMKDRLAVLEANFLKKTSTVLSNEQRAKLVFQEEKLKSEMQKRFDDRNPEMSKRDFDRNKKIK